MSTTKTDVFCLDNYPTRAEIKEGATRRAAAARQARDDFYAFRVGLGLVHTVCSPSGWSEKQWNRTGEERVLPWGGHWGSEYLYEYEHESTGLKAWIEIDDVTHAVEAYYLPREVAEAAEVESKYNYTREYAASEIRSIRDPNSTYREHCMRMVARHDGQTPVWA